MPAVRTMKPRPFGGFSSQQDVAQPAAGVVVFDLARHADAAQRRHQHQVAAGDADVGGERRALGADAFLDDLDEHFVAAAEDVLDRRLDARPHAGAHAPRPRSGCRRCGGVARPLSPTSSDRRRHRRRRRARRRRRRRASAAAVGHDRLVGIEAALAEVLRLDVADVQKAVAADAEVDERRLDARLQVDDLALVDVADVVVLAGPLDVQLFQHAVFDDRDPALFRLRRR